MIVLGVLALVVVFLFVMFAVGWAWSRGDR